MSHPEALQRAALARKATPDELLEERARTGGKVVKYPCRTRTRPNCKRP